MHELNIKRLIRSMRVLEHYMEQEVPEKVYMKIKATARKNPLLGFKPAGAGSDDSDG